jgi:hypothetical protein
MRFACPRPGTNIPAQSNHRFDITLGVRLFRFPHSRPGRNGQHQLGRQTVSMAGLCISTSPKSSFICPLTALNYSIYRYG